MLSQGYLWSHQPALHTASREESTLAVLEATSQGKLGGMRAFKNVLGTHATTLLYMHTFRLNE